MNKVLADWPAPDPVAQASEPPVERRSLAFWGVLGGLLMPIIGLVIAVVLFVRGEVGPGLGVCLASFLGFIGAILFL